jgi:hypothetical protein
LSTLQENLVCLLLWHWICFRCQWLSYFIKICLYLLLPLDSAHQHWGLNWILCWSWSLCWPVPFDNTFCLPKNARTNLSNVFQI